MAAKHQNIPGWSDRKAGNWAVARMRRLKKISTVVVLCSLIKLSWRVISSDRRVLFSWETDISCAFSPWKRHAVSLKVWLSIKLRKVNFSLSAAGVGMSVVILVPSALSFSKHENGGAGKIHLRIAKIWLETWLEKNTRQKSFLEEVFNVSPYIYFTACHVSYYKPNIATLRVYGEPKEGLHFRRGWLANSNPAFFSPSSGVREGL